MVIIQHTDSYIWLLSVFLRFVHVVPFIRSSLLLTAGNTIHFKTIPNVSDCTIMCLSMMLMDPWDVSSFGLSSNMNPKEANGRKGLEAVGQIMA